MGIAEYVMVVVACSLAVLGFGILFLRKKKNVKIKAAFKETEKIEDKPDMTGEDKGMEE